MVKIAKISQNKGLTALILLFVLSIFASIIALRANNIKMMELRQALYVADEKNGDVESALNDLRQFVYSHMNTDLRNSNNSDEPPIQLVHKFNRAVAAEQARVAALGTANKVYTDAQKQCENSSLPLTARAQCIQEYVSKYGKGVAQLNLPPKELYTFDFASPAWSPDVAGFMILATIVFGLSIIADVIYRLVKAKL